MVRSSVPNFRRGRHSASCSSSLIWKISLFGAIAFAFASWNAHGGPQASPNVSQQQPTTSAPSVNPSGSQLLEVPPAAAGEDSGGLLQIPQLATPEIPSMPLPLQSPVIPPGFTGCWTGNPGGFDRVATDKGNVVGTPGQIYFCYGNHAIKFQSADIVISPQARAGDIARHLGLGYTTLKAKGIKTDVYLVTADTLRSRSYIDIEVTDHLLYLIPIKFHEHMVEDEVSKLAGPNMLTIYARFVLTAPQQHMWGTWHADFHRVADVPRSTE